jgi:Fe-S-cluster containining protein
VTVITQIKSPRGIRFSCSACGNCCLQWPVPLTEEDYERISNLASSPHSAPVRKLNSSRENLFSFTHTLEKGNDGRCAYLSDDKRCHLHIEQGSRAKPSMCQLFPYSFTVTPSSVIASLSFASSAVLFNTGELLQNQQPVLEEQFRIFNALFKAKPELWESLQLIDGKVLSWHEFEAIDERILQVLEEGSENTGKAPAALPRKLKKAAEILSAKLGSPADAEKEPRLEARPKVVDQILLKHLDRLYFPEDEFNCKYYDIDARGVLAEMVAAPNTVTFGSHKKELKFSELINIKIGALADEVEDLLNRFLYVRYFSKQFFGPGFHHFSLLSGLNHLRTLHVLLRLKLKQEISLQAIKEPSLEHMAELIRTMERRLTQLELSPQSQAMLEVMFCSLQRQERISFLAE